jgi:hypothetical protein
LKDFTLESPVKKPLSSEKENAGGKVTETVVISFDDAADVAPEDEQTKPAALVEEMTEEEIQELRTHFIGEVNLPESMSPFAS